MAKKKRKEEEEEFSLPEFNEEEFLRKEITGAKVMIVILLLAIIAAVVSYLLTRAGVVIVAFFAGVAAIFLLKYFLRFFKVDTSKFERKDWMGHGFTFFFAWLAIWVLVMNVPFADVTSPSLAVFVDGKQYATGSDAFIYSSYAIIDATATDNAGIKEVRISVNGANPVTMQQVGITMWTYNLTGFNNISDGKGITVITEDVSGNPPISVQLTITRRPPP